MGELKREDLERLTYWHGQTLRSADFNAQVEFAAQRRWWHNRALHNAYGIVDGYAVELSTDGQSVTIGAGIAYDAYGRELILARDRTLKLPVTADPRLSLLISYKETAAFPPRDDPVGLCALETLMAEQPDFRWVTSGRIDPRAGVKLAEWRKGKDGQWEAIDCLPPHTRSFARSRLGSGATVPGDTAWEPGELHTLFPVMSVQIDTSSAGFAQTPGYFASLQMTADMPLLFRRALTAICISESIDDERPDSFVFRITFIPFGSAIVRRTLLGGRRNERTALLMRSLYVNWLAVEFSDNLVDERTPEVLSVPIG